MTRSHAGSFPGVSVFIPTYNDATDLAPCLESLRALQYPRHRLEIVVWDNASDDGTATMVEGKFREMSGEGWLGLRLLHSERNHGPYVPYNLVETSLAPESDYTLGMDADVEVAPDVLTRLVAAAEKGSAAVVGARSVYFDRPDRTAHGAGFVARWSTRYGEADPDEPIDCDYVIGCCWLLDRHAFREVGGFDPCFFINHWEVDYCLRLKQRGWRICYEPRAVVRHKVSPGGSLSDDRIYYLFRNKLLMVRRNPYFRSARVAGGACMLLSLARIVAGMVGGGDVHRARVAWQGLRDGLRGLAGVRPGPGS